MTPAPAEYRGTAFQLVEETAVGEYTWSGTDLYLGGIIVFLKPQGSPGVPWRPTPAFP